MVVQAHAVAGQAERGDGVEEARGQAPEAAVAEGGLDLELLDRAEVVAGVGELLAHVVKEPRSMRLFERSLPMRNSAEI